MPVWFLPCTWIRWVIQRCFQWVIWWRRGRGFRQNFDIVSWCMDTLLFLCVFQYVFTACWSSVTCCYLFIQASISACLFCSSAYSFAFLISLSSLQASYWRWRYSPLSWVLLIASLWRNTSSNPCLASFILQKLAEACGCLFLSEWYRRASLG